jgi:hypothetical protein
MGEIHGFLGRRRRDANHRKFLWVLQVPSVAQGKTHQFSIDEKRVTIHNNATNTGFCKFVYIVGVWQTFNSRTDLFGLLQYRLNLAITLRYLTYEAINVRQRFSFLRGAI